MSGGKTIRKLFKLCRLGVMVCLYGFKHMIFFNIVFLVLYLRCFPLFNADPFGFIVMKEFVINRFFFSEAEQPATASGNKQVNSIRVKIFIV